MNPVEKMALLVRLISAAIGRSGRQSLSKTRIQELTYLAQSLGLDSGFEFRMHHYGPYSFDLEDTVQALQGFGILDCQVDAREAFTEYCFATRREADAFAQQVGGIGGEREKVLRLVVDLYASRPARDLELLGTVHLVDRLLVQGASERPHLHSVVDSVHSLKPYFSREEIEEAHAELVSTGALGS
jgi:hypothetical protein